MRNVEIFPCNMDKLCLLICLMLQGCITSSLGYTFADETQLRTNLIKVSTYDRLARPDDLTTVTIGLSILAINNLDIKSQQFSASGWLTVTWTDSRITWAPASNGNTEYIHALPTEIWYPEVFIDNSYNEFERIGQSDLIFRVKYTGEVHWEPPVLFEVYCNIDVTYYPFDQQKCTIEILSWGLPKTELTVQLASTEVDFGEYRENGQWDVMSSSAKLSDVTEVAHGGVETYVQVIYEVKIRRRVDFYVINTVFPIVLTSFLIVITFIVPSECGEKLSFSFTILLTVAVLLTLYIGDLPDVSTSTSILAMYLAFTLFFSTLATLLTTFVLIFHHRADTVPMSPFHRQLLGRIMFFIRWKALNQKQKVKRDEDMDDEWDTESKSKNNNAESQSRSQLTKFTSRNLRNVVTPEAADNNELVNATSMLDRLNELTPHHEGKARKGNCVISWKETALIWDKFAFIVGMVVTSLYNVIFIMLMAVGGYNQSS